MFRGIRRYSIKNIPVETQPKNRFNAERSVFNLRPVNTPGLIHNPPASMPSIKETPLVFLPKNDPRLKIMADKFKVYTPEELKTMPVIYGAKKDYSLTPDIVKEIIQLREEDPNVWTILRLAARFNVDQDKVNVITGFSKLKQEKALAELQKLKAGWSAKKLEARNDRSRRKQMWLRGEF